MATWDNIFAAIGTGFLNSQKYTCSKKSKNYNLMGQKEIHETRNT